MELEITLPFLALLRCRLGVAVFNNDDDKHARGFRIRLFKEELWLEKVRTLAEEFSWDEYRKPELPKVKPQNGTLEFVGGSASRRALAVAIRAITKHDIDNIPVTLMLS